MSEPKYVAADISSETRRKVQEIARAEKMTRAVMLGRLVEAGIDAYERKRNRRGNV